MNLINDNRIWFYEFSLEPEVDLKKYSKGVGIHLDESNSFVIVKIPSKNKVIIDCYFSTRSVCNMEKEINLMELILRDDFESRLVHYIFNGEHSSLFLVDQIEFLEFYYDVYCYSFCVNFSSKTHENIIYNCNNLMKGIIFIFKYYQQQILLDPTLFTKKKGFFINQFIKHTIHDIVPFIGNDLVEYYKMKDKEFCLDGLLQKYEYELSKNKKNKIYYSGKKNTADNVLPVYFRFDDELPF